MTDPRAARAGRGNARSARRMAREFALQGIYAWLLRGGEDLGELGEIDAHVRDGENFGDADIQWYQTLLQGTVSQADALRERFKPYIDRTIAELSPIEHAILLIGSFELVHHVEVPYRVAINEAVELAKSFGGTDGFRFVNGVLDKLAADARAAEVGAGTRR
ncbi:transcription antitermination factor NusB [Castellaniella sp. S9]|uniref:transcription antitermination factor NusB n=1 Tax=Castellaniella sp. S9 TaxID=2993652 RepID=UPI0022B5625C|nr:transcription antitermination factor NusB [Castellaniella sp. S9]